MRASNAAGSGPWSKSLAFTVVAAPSSAKAITAFSFASPAATGVINETLHTIAVSVPFGTNVSALVASFTTTGASVAIAGTPQVSGVTAVNFSNPVTYTVTAADASTQAYVVTVTVAPPPSSAKAITAFSFASPAATGVINEALHTIAVSVPYGTNVSALVPSITITGASVSPLSGAAQNFTSPVTYTVTAADASTQAYVVTVTVALSSAKAITAFSFTVPAATGVINETLPSIAVSVPYGTNRTSLVASFTTTGASVSVAGTLQVSGVTPNNFTCPLHYTVVAADASTQAYVVTVTVAPLAIGDTFGGGIVAYILMSGDPGYVGGETHGLIAATADQSAGIAWADLIYQSSVVPGGTGTAIGTGGTNTSNIIAQNGWLATYAANVARSYTGGDFIWHLPSKDELNKLYLNRAAIGGFASARYWSSSEDGMFAWYQDFGGGGQGSWQKGSTYRVRAVRAF